MADDACNVDTHKVFNSNLCCHNDILIPDADFFKAPCLSEIGFNSYYTLYDYTKESDISYELSSHTDKNQVKRIWAFPK